MPHLKWFLRVLGALLLVVAIVGVNGGIYFSSVPHQEQMGWAEFCSINAIWIAALGVLTLVASDSHEVAMHELDRKEKRKAQAAA